MPEPGRATDKGVFSIYRYTDNVKWVNNTLSPLIDGTIQKI